MTAENGCEGLSLGSPDLLQEREGLVHVKVRNEGTV